MKVGIMTSEQMKEYSIKVAKGQIKVDPNGPKVFFSSLRALSEALNDQNKEIISAIIKHKPESIKELSEIIGRDEGNVSRSLKRLENYGLLKLVKNYGKEKRPVALADQVILEESILLAS